MIEVFLDSADILEIRKYSDFIDGVTTNPTLLSKVQCDDVCDVILEICNTVRGPVSVEVIADDADSMVLQAKKVAKLSDNIVIKLPCTYDGFSACAHLSNVGIATNMTLCFSITQALLAAKSGATYVSPFIGRLDDIGADGLALVEDITEIFYNNFSTKVLAASVRNISHVSYVMKIGADAMTIPPKLFSEFFDHPLTNTGLKIFNDDWGNKPLLGL